MKAGYIYILTNWTNTVMYIGVTSNLQQRLYQHKIKAIEGFSEKYNTNKLVYYEQYDDVETAILREKEIKKWRREKKNKLVETLNPEWNNLEMDIY